MRTYTLSSRSSAFRFKDYTFKGNVSDRETDSSSSPQCREISQEHAVHPGRRVLQSREPTMGGHPLCSFTIWLKLSPLMSCH